MEIPPAAMGSHALSMVRFVMESIEQERLIQIARESRERAYAPYSSFRVGAAVLAVDGEIFGGCNVENISYGLSICAERVAICNAVAAGQSTFRAIAVVSHQGATPCGACRQFIAEFGTGTQVLLVDADEPHRIESFSIDTLLPRSFSFE